MFDQLTQRLQGIFGRLRGKGKLNESDVNEVLREVRLALLEADVNFKVVREFIARIRAKAVGEEVFNSLSPAQTVVKIVHAELVALLGSKTAKLTVAPAPPTVVLLSGLQGSGKTTTAAKLALASRKGGKKPYLVAADVHRPAAVDQLQALGRQLDIPVYAEEGVQDAAGIAGRGVARAKSLARDLVLVDTAGRSQLDEEMMEEAGRIAAAVRPTEILLVVDAMTGQEAVAVAEGFRARLQLTGLILTKLDGDARGGAALSIREITGCPILYVGVGEKPDALEPFHPDRLASRILGMGDVLTLIEKAQEVVDVQKAAQMERKLRRAELTLEDFLEQLRQVRRMGPLNQILSLLPGVGELKKMKNMEVDERELSRVEAIICSMTRDERHNPVVINGSRRRRIANGSGCSVQDVNRLLKQFEDTRKLLKNLAGMKKGKHPFPPGIPGFKP